uniref:(northern house mosquito) hypothetical protein n=1 Tax=Culex pipiens TaxID=7175 RepID=A0A8D8K2G9_CULPI
MDLTTTNYKPPEDETIYDQNTLEPAPVPSLQEFLGQTYRILYGDEYHPNYDRQLRKFVTHLVEVPPDTEQDDDDDELEDEFQLTIDEDNRVELVIDVKVLFDEEIGEEMNANDRAALETSSLIQQIHVILYESDKKGEIEEDVREE